MRRYQTILFIVVIIAIAIWLVLPNVPPVFGFKARTVLGLDLQGGVQALLEADLPANQAINAQDMLTAKKIVENRINGLGVSEAIVQGAGDRRILVEIPGIVDPEQAISTIKTTGLLEFIDMSEITPEEALAFENTTVVTDYGGSSTQEPITPTVTLTPTAPPTSTITTTATTTSTVATPPKVWHTIMTGTDLKEVSVTTDQTGKPNVSFVLTDNGSKIFADFTSKNVGKVLAISLDKTIISTPRIENPITDGRGVITGNFTAESANALATQLRYGSLPIPLKVVESSTVGPTLGQDSLRRSLIAGAIGLGMVIIFMSLYYRLPGLVADMALICYALIVFALFRTIPVTLTLPGIAGFVLSIGMAVDANVLIFERLKEELRSGRTLRQAIDLGWGRAWPSIRDSNISTIITCIILYWFGSAYGASIVKGFSVTLFLGVVISLFTAIIVSRTFLHLVLDNVKLAEHPRWFGV